jgi:DNA-binding NtrC family response regulator
MADAQSITEADLELEAFGPSATSPAAPNGTARCFWTATSSCLKEAREQLEREMVAMAMERHGGNISAAAKDLGISRPTFYELMSKLGISKD